MQILVIQLARFGDIYQTWPILKGLKRQYPDAQIDCMVREKYKAALSGHPDIRNAVVFNTPQIMSPLLFQDNGIEMALIELELVLKPLMGTYDKIINLSFSPVSSYIVDVIAKKDTEVRGYHRTTDGFLKLKDDASAYFYAQVGTDRTSRLHLIDVFSLVAGVDLKHEDFSFHFHTKLELNEKRIVIHVGGSQNNKICTKAQWQAIIQDLAESYNGSIYLIGTENESPIVDKPVHNVVNLCGKTKIEDIPSYLQGAELLIACDSMLLQVANLTNTKSLNISYSSVRFWETGPRVSGSRVVCFSEPAATNEVFVLDEIKNLLKGSAPQNGVFEVKDSEGVRFYGGEIDPQEDFQWQLIEAIYMGKTFPATDDAQVILALSKLQELASLGLDQVENLMAGKNISVSGSILDQVDLLMGQIAHHCVSISPLIRWFQCEKLRIEPGTVESVGLATKNVFMQLYEVTRLYTLGLDMQNQRGQEGELTWK